MPNKTVLPMGSTSNIKYDKVFFCSAYNDISHILALMERKENNNCLIIISSKYNIYTFFNKLNLNNTQILFISSKLTTLWNPIRWMLELLNVITIRRRILSKIHDSEIIFFTSVYDLLTCSCVNYLRSNNELYLSIPIEDDFVPLERRSLKTKLLSLIYGVKLELFSRFQDQVIGLPLSFIDKNVDTDLLASEEELFKVRKKYAISVFDERPFFLILDAKYNYDKIIYNYYTDITRIFRFLSTYNIYVKGHPQLGLSSLALNFHFKRIDADIPIEFIDLSNCKCVIGIESIALANIANVGVQSISLLKILNYKDNSIRDNWLNYFATYSNKVLFPASFDELKTSVTDHQQL